MLKFTRPSNISILLILLFVLNLDSIQAQETKPFYSTVDIGFGAGLDYGGGGIRFAGKPHKRVALFFGAGIWDPGIGVNGGAYFRFMPEKRACLYYTLMYGKNESIDSETKMNNIVVQKINKSYYGLSTGLGLELHSRKQNGNYWNFELLVRFRSSEYFYDRSRISLFFVEVGPILPSIGYHIGL